jgi:adenylate cyclase class 2
MPIEIEKKYRLSKKQRNEVMLRLPAIGAKRKGEDFEVNTLYTGESLEMGNSVLRLRRIGKRGILTYKQRFPSNSDIKRQQEDETRVDDPDAMEAILDALGFVASLVYEKRRETWTLGKTEVVIDELPFGWYMEIEGAEKDNLTYPRLTQKHGTDHGGVIEARFSSKG